MSLCEWDGDEPEGLKYASQGQRPGFFESRVSQALEERNRGRAEAYFAPSGLEADVVLARSQGVALG